MPTIFNVVEIPPSCNICNDGEIRIQAFGPISGYSIDGGQTFTYFPPGVIATFTDLPTGDYNIVVQGPCPNFFPGNPVTLAAPVVVDANCDNGGFGSGDYSNWTLESAAFDDDQSGTVGAFTNLDENVVNTGFSLIQDGAFSDSEFPGGTIFSPTGGTYVSILGDRSTLTTGGFEIYRMTNCFTVNQDNADFAFNYALVLFNPNHDPEEEPYFAWRIYEESNGNVIASQKVISGTSFFENTSNSRSIKGWSCVSQDLAAYLGENVCVEMEIGECTRGGHGGYAYIDGICENATESAPVCDFSIDAICGSQGGNFGIDFNNPTNSIEEFKVDICLNGTCSSNTFQDGFNLPGIDLFSIASNAGFSLIDGEEYTVQITLRNGCGECFHEDSFIYRDFEFDVNYPNQIIVCNPELSEVQIPV